MNKTLVVSALVALTLVACGKTQDQLSSNETGADTAKIASAKQAAADATPAAAPASSEAAAPAAAPAAEPAAAAPAADSADKPKE